jgi:hypothetical protein
MRAAKYRQSLITKISPHNITIVGGFLILYKTILATATHGRANYLLNLKPGKYELATKYDEYYVYAEINTTTAETEIKISEQDITEHGNGLPNNYPNNKLFFNTQNDKSFIKTVNGWVENIRVNLCKVSNGIIEKTYTGLSQVYTRPVLHKAGTIQYDDNHNPMQVESQDGFRFITDVDVKLLNLQDVKSLSLENINIENIAGIDIEQYDLLIRTPEYGITRGTSVSTDNDIIAIALNDASNGEECFIKEQGFIKDPAWRWIQKPNTKLFCDSNGRLSTIPDWSSNSIQEVGYIVDVDTIYFDPKEKISINSLKSTMLSV